MQTLPAEIFKAYDIRGIVDKSLTAEVVYRIGQALGSLAIEQGQTAIAVGRDGRLSGPTLAGALMDGICAAGCDAIDVGCVPTPVTYFAAYELGCHSCVSVTGSHNPPDYNGLKMVIGGTTLALDALDVAPALHLRQDPVGCRTSRSFHEPLKTMIRMGTARVASTLVRSPQDWSRCHRRHLDRGLV